MNFRARDSGAYRGASCGFGRKHGGVHFYDLARDVAMNNRSRTVSAVVGLFVRWENIHDDWLTGAQRAIAMMMTRCALRPAGNNVLRSAESTFHQKDIYGGVHSF